MAAKRPQAKTQGNSNPPKKRASKTVGSRLHGQVAVVTGASRGIGFAIARALAAEGGSVVITGRDAKTLARSARKIESALPKSMRSARAPHVVAEVCDVRDPASVEALFAAVKQRFGAIDILVNNAGITQRIMLVEETTLEMWREVIDTDLTSVFLCTRCALPLMRSGGTIVNNISLAAKVTFPKFATYTAAKHGVLGFTLALREELIPRGIRVVALMPGAADTELWNDLWPDAPRERMMSPDTVAQTVLSATLLPRDANLSEIVLAPIGGAL